MNELKPEDVMRAVKKLRNHGLSNGGAIGYHAGWCDEVADLLEKALSLPLEKDALLAELDSKKAELKLKNEHIDRLIEMAYVTEREIEEKDKEIERLSSRVSMLHEIEISYALQYGTAIDKDIARRQLRAEAVDEFVERVKKAHDVLDVNGYLMIGVDIVELIAEEMKG